MRRRGAMGIGVSFVATALLAGGATAAGGPRSDTVPPDDTLIDALLEHLTAEQVLCLYQGIDAVPDDDVAAFDVLLDECGVTDDQLDAILDDDGGDSAGPLSTGPQQDGEFANIGLDAATSECVADRIAFTPPVDDQTAMILYLSCGGSVVDLVTAIAGGATPIDPAAATAAPSAPLTTWVPTGDPIVDAFAEQIVAGGTEMTREELICVAEGAVADFAAATTEDGLTELLASCGVDPDRF